jgi:hypothetical protein
MTNMTAVKQLIYDLRNIDMSIFNEEHCKKYLEMEKQQIEDAFDKGKWDSMAFKGTPKEQYYNETYGK